jgi:hypothetical protein
MLVKHLLESINGMDRNLYEYIFKNYKGSSAPYTFIRYNDTLKDGIKPSKFSGLFGLGMYGITIDAFLGGYDEMQMAHNNEEIKHAIIYKAKDNDKILYTDTYKYEDYKRDLVKLFEIHRDNLMKFMSTSEERVPFRLLMEAIAKVLKDDPDITTRHVLTEMGYQGIVDYKRSGSGAYPVQCVMYSSSFVDTIETLSIDVDRMKADYKEAVTGDKYGYTAKKLLQLGDNTIY